MFGLAYYSYWIWIWCLGLFLFVIWSFKYFDIYYIGFTIFSLVHLYQVKFRLKVLRTNWVYLEMCRNWACSNLRQCSPLIDVRNSFFISIGLLTWSNNYHPWFFFIFIFNGFWCSGWIYTCQDLWTDDIY